MAKLHASETAKQILREWEADQEIIIQQQRAAREVTATHAIPVQSPSNLRAISMLEATLQLSSVDVDKSESTCLPKAAPTC